MSKENIYKKSLREHVLESIGNFLYKEKFPQCDVTPAGILNLIDLIASYHEEGRELHPEILLTTDLSSVLEALPFARKVQIGMSELTVNSFSHALKLCAPLATGGWIMYIETFDSSIRYGLTSAELSEVSPSFYRQILGDLSTHIENTTVAYIRNNGRNIVLLEGRKNRLLISLSLKEVGQKSDSIIAELCREIISDVEEEIREVGAAFFEKLINASLLESHGVLIGVVSEDNEAISNLRLKLSDGAYIENPIDIISHLKISESEKTRESSTSVRAYETILKAMLSHDGITILTSQGKLLGYHCFISLAEKQLGSVIGGARSRAFEAMKGCKLFRCSFYRSQDGRELIWRANE